MEVENTLVSKKSKAIFIVDFTATTTNDIIVIFFESYTVQLQYVKMFAWFSTSLMKFKFVLEMYCHEDKLALMEYKRR